MKKFAVFITIVEMLSFVMIMVSFHFPPQSYDYHQELMQQMWTRILGKRNPYMLMVGV